MGVGGCQRSLSFLCYSWRAALEARYQSPARWHVTTAATLFSTVSQHAPARGYGRLLGSIRNCPNSRAPAPLTVRPRRFAEMTSSSYRQRRICRAVHRRRFLMLGISVFGAALLSVPESMLDALSLNGVRSAAHPVLWVVTLVAFEFWIVGMWLGQRRMAPRRQRLF